MIFMKLFHDNNIIAAFSDAGDGDLALYKMPDEQVKLLWNSLPVVGQYDLALPTYGHQVHEARIMPVEADTASLLAGEADGVITGLTDRPVGVFSADCLPLLIYADEAVAAVHAGWRSTCLNIAGQAVSQFSAQYGIAAAALRVYIGPCIGKCCLEMGDEVFEQFVAVDRQWQQFFVRRGRWHLNLRALNRWQLQQAGVLPDKIVDYDKCTFCREGEYFSFRRQRQHNGSMFSFVVRLNN